MPSLAPTISTSPSPSSTSSPSPSSTSTPHVTNATPSSSSSSSTTTPSSSSTPPKPLILCLHGGGTNASIFSIQTIRLQRLLSADFSFIYPEGPFSGPAGPGVLPTFEGCGPFYRWTRIERMGLPVKSREVLEGVVGFGEGDGERERGARKSEVEGNGEVVGVLGFSQGAKVAAGLLLEQQRFVDQMRREEGDGYVSRGLPMKENTASTMKHAFNWNLKFAVLMNGGGPPATTGVDDADDAEQERIKDIPTLHVLGKQDPYLEKGRELYARWFEGGEIADGDRHEGKQKGKAVLLEFDVGHRLPVEAKDSEKVAGEIRRMWRETGGCEESARC